MLPTRRALVSSALVLSALLSLGACAKNAQAPPALRVALVTDDSALGDPLLNASAIEGIAAVKQMLGADVTLARARSAMEYRADLTLDADQDYDEVFGVGPATGTSMTQVARRYPRRNFALVGAASPEPNVASIAFRVEQGAFLAGVLAALTARSRAIELSGGPGDARERALRSGFVAGVREMGMLRAVRVRAAGSTAGGSPAATLYEAPGGVTFVTATGPRAGTVLARVVERADVAVLQVAADARSLKVPAGPTPFGIAERGVELGLTARAKRAAGSAGLARLARIRDALGAGLLVAPSSAAQLAAFKPLAL